MLASPPSLDRGIRSKCTWRSRFRFEYILAEGFFTPKQADRAPSCDCALLTRSNLREPRKQDLRQAGYGCIHPNLREYRHMTVTIDIPKEIEARLLSEAQAAGVPFGQLVQDVLIDHFEEAEDRLVAESRLEDRQAPITAHQLRKNLGLDN